MAPIIKTFLKTIKIALIMFGTLFLLSGIILFSKDKIGSGVLISIGAGMIFGATRIKLRGIAQPPTMVSTPAPVLPVPQCIEEAPPAPPTETPSQVWGWLSQPIDVANTFKFRSIYREILADEPDFESESGAEIKVKVVVWRDKANTADTNAVGVWLERHFLGHFPADLAALYAPALDRLGRPVEAPGRIWGRDDEGTVRARTSLYLPEPDALVIFGEAPKDDEILLPEGPKIQVLGEEHHMDILKEYVPTGPSRLIWLRLAKSVDFRPRSARDRIDVFLDGARVGWLSDIQTKNLLPLVDFVLERGKTPVVRGNIAGSKLQAKLTLQVAKADGVPNEWLDGQGAAIQPVNKRAEFDWDD